MSRLSRVPMLIVVVWASMSIVNAQEKEQPPQEKKEVVTARILVLDPDGLPLDGATVTPYAMRHNQANSGHYVWNESLHGSPPMIVTNADGIAEVPIPKFVVEKLEIGEVSWRIEHPEYVLSYADREINNNPAEVRLERGFRLAVTAIDGETGNPVTADLYAVMSDSAIDDWKLTDNGTLVSPVFRNAEKIFRVMRISEGEPLLFSEAITVVPDDRSRILLKDIKLSRGTRVEGRLADSVARPVKNGFVTAQITNAVNPVRQIRWIWNEQTPIAEDGTFVFESLPPNEVLQLIPICDDWVAKLPSKESVQEFFPMAVAGLNNRRTWPQLIKLEGETVKPILDMERATSVRVIVSDTNGNPLANATVHMSPNQVWFDGGSQLLGAGRSSRDVLVQTREGSYKVTWPNRFSAGTDDQGVVVIKNLPANRLERLAVTHDDFELPILNDQRIVQVDLKPDDVTEVKVQMQKKGTEMLGDGNDGKEAEKKQDDGGGVENLE